jgi:hypothetical protein
VKVIRIPGRAEFVIGGDFPRIELIGLTEILRDHASFNLLLVFEQAGKISIHVVVDRRAANNEGADATRSGNWL